MSDSQRSDLLFLNVLIGHFCHHCGCAIVNVCVLLTGDGVCEPIWMFGDERVLDVPPANAVST